MASKINQWIEDNPFWAESLRTIAFSFLGTVVAIFIIKYFENKMNYGWDKKKARLGIQLEAINSFLNSSYEFTSQAVRYKEKSISDTLLRDKYDFFRNKLHILKINCDTLDSSLDDKGESLSAKMMLLINSRDSLKLVKESGSDSYEKVRRSIKNDTDTIVFRLNSAIDEQD
ncbi:MAG: hypothetical protein QM791_03225 [Ferruginibacter sp.]